MTQLHNNLNGAAIGVRNLHVTYPARRKQPARQAVSGLDFTIASGQFVALLGPNGSGKSSLMRAICGLVPFEGRITLHGETRLDAMRQALGVVLQNTSLDPQMTVRENLCDLAALHGIPREDAARRIERDLANTGLTEHANVFVKRLSGGLKRRVDLVRSLMHQPSVLLLDEPTVGLDPPSRKAFLDSLGQRRSQHEMTVLLSTHLIDEAEQSDRVLFMHEGRLVADDSPEALRRSLGDRQLTVLSSAEPPFTSYAWIRTTTGWTTTLDDNASSVGELCAQLLAIGLAFTIAPPTLGDAFESLTGTTLRSENHV